MSESRVHVLPDENLGGVLREYVEVEGVYANNDDYVVIRSQDVVNYPIKMSKITITSLPSDSQIVKLEPTDIVHIDDTRYRLVDRKAKVGDKFINKAGEVHTVNTELMRDSLNMGKYFFRLIEPVTEPVEVDTRHASPQVIDMLANLAQRVTELERELSEIKKVTNTEMGARSVHTVRWLEVKDEIDTLHANQRKLAEETTNRLDRHSERIRELAEMIGEQKTFKIDIDNRYVLEVKRK
jgi:hypothetical protein